MLGRRNRWEAWESRLAGDRGGARESYFSFRLGSEGCTTSCRKKGESEQGKEEKKKRKKERKKRKKVEWRGLLWREM